MSEKNISYLAQCLVCTEPKTPWSFSTYEARAEWVGKHRVTTGHAVKLMLGVA